ncbi:MAG TPA: hypothetical protein PKH51_00055, partial [Candidatus Sumerlaeota bacterium]|nr:hypothetical protein [Candidatus Sumerlaeota bacterium]
MADFSSRNEAKLNEVERQFNARIVLRGNVLKIIGASEDVERAAAMISEIRDVQRKGGELSQQEFKQAVRHASHRT